MKKILSFILLILLSYGLSYASKEGARIGIIEAPKEKVSKEIILQNKNKENKTNTYVDDGKTKIIPATKTKDKKTNN
ncbi:MAG: hypothetical protein OEZ22_03635 [Spirochaetia bacterium]|nr:hypothetical protein [Spirochaetia bacterium]